MLDVYIAKMPAKCPTLEEVLGDIPPEKIDQPCQDKHLCLIAPHIVDWSELSPGMGIARAEEEEIKRDWPSYRRQKVEMLRVWAQKRQRKQKDTYRNLCKAFLAAQQTRLADKVCEILECQGSSSESSSDESDESTPSRKRLKLSLKSPPFDPKHKLKEASSSEVHRTDSSTAPAIKVNLLEVYSKYLRTTYDIQTPGFVVLQWPPPPTLKVFNLAMIHSPERVQRNIPNEKLVKLVLRGQVNKVIEGKVLVKMKNLFALDDRRRKVVLIEGAPGAGKSTLAWHICQKWKARELFDGEFKVVIYVQLRDPEVQSATSVVELLPTYPGIKREDLAAEIESCFGTRVLFVLDGWDEYQPGLQEDSLFYKLINNPQKLYLQRRTLLITSRPVASRELQSYATYRVEILGFTPGEVRQYFEEALEDPLAVQNLQDQLRERPVVEASCYLPLNAAIVAHLFKELNHTLPTTLHGVFSTVVCGCIRRHLKKQSGKEIEIPSFDELPSSVQEDFQSMCTLAYEGSMVNKVTFSGQDLKSYGLSAELNVLDLMQVVQSFASQKSTLYHFLHLSVQELLTARNISKLSETEQIRIFEDLFENPRFAAVFRFYSAFTKLQTNGIRDIVTRVAQNGTKTQLNLMHCLYEAQDVSLCCFVASQLNGKLDLHRVTFSPLDCLSVGYFLSCICQGTSEEFEVRLPGCSLESYNSSFLQKGLSTCSTPGVDNPSIHHPLPGHLKLSLMGEGVRGRHVQCLSEVISHSSVISKLDLSANEIQEGEDGLVYLLQALGTNTSVVQLQMQSCNMTITKDNGPLLVEMLQENRTLKELDLAGNPISPTALRYIVEGLRHNTGLVKLLLGKCSLKVTEGDSPLLEEILKENRLVLKELDLADNPIGPTGLGYVAKGLRHNTGLVKLSLHLAVTKENGPLLEEMLETNSTLMELDISESSGISDEGLLTLGKGLKANRGLTTLNLTTLPAVTREGWRQFMLCLIENNHLTKLKIGKRGAGPLLPEIRAVNSARQRQGLPPLETNCFMRNDEIVDFNRIIAKDECDYGRWWESGYCGLH